MNPINHNIFQEPGYHPQVEAISPTPDDRTAERDDVSSFFMFMMMMRSFFMIMMIWGAFLWSWGCEQLFYDHDDVSSFFYDHDDLSSFFMIMMMMRSFFYDDDEDDHGDHIWRLKTIFKTPRTRCAALRTTCCRRSRRWTGRSPRRSHRLPSWKRNRWTSLGFSISLFSLRYFSRCSVMNGLWRESCDATSRLSYFPRSKL